MTTPPLDAVPRSIPALGKVLQRPYRVSGATAADLADAITLLGPRRDGRRFAALTLWTLRWSFQPAFADGAWRAIDVRVDLDVVVHMPEWRPPRTAADALVAAWRSYVVALAEHEGGHVAIARGAAGDVAALLAATTSITASDLALTVDEGARDLVAAARDAELLYDADTRHGHTQGARWDASAGGAWHGASVFPGTASAAAPWPATHPRDLRAGAHAGWPDRGITAGHEP